MQTMVDFWVPSPIDIVERRTQPAFTVPWQHRSFHHMLLVVSGQGSCQMEGHSFPLEEGMLVYHPVHQHFGYTSCSEDPFHYVGMNFTLAVLKGEQLSGRVEERLPIATASRPANPDKLLRMFREMIAKWNDEHEHRQMWARSFMLQLLVEIFKSGRSPGNRRNEETIKKVAAYMKRHAERQLSLSQLAALAGFAPSYFGALFHRVMGETPIEYLHTLRIELAIEHMMCGCPIQEAAARAGFREPYYFSRVFKRKKGMSPSAYLKHGEGLL